MELKDTIEMMTSADFKERFKAEYYQTVLRVEKLEKMLINLEKGELKFTPKSDHAVLYAQLAFMKSYVMSLWERAQDEGVELKHFLSADFSSPDFKLE